MAQHSNSMNLEGIENMNVSNVKNMQSMFSCAGYDLPNFSLDLSAWDVSNVTDMSWMFEAAGRNSESFYLNLSNWNVRNVNNFRYFFEYCGYLPASWIVDGLEEWNTEEATNMYGMFYHTGNNADYFLDLSDWNVANVTIYTNFNYKVEDKVVAPVWVN